MRHLTMRKTRYGFETQWDSLETALSAKPFVLGIVRRFPDGKALEQWLDIPHRTLRAEMSSSEARWIIRSVTHMWKNDITDAYASYAKIMER